MEQEDEACKVGKQSIYHTKMVLKGINLKGFALTGP